MVLGPGYGYFANPSKTWLIVKPEHLSYAGRFFQDSGVNITTEGKRHLGAALGEKSTIDSYVKGKVQQWVNEVEELATVARTHSQVAYAAFTHGMASNGHTL